MFKTYKPASDKPKRPRSAAQQRHTEALAWASRSQQPGETKKQAYARAISELGGPLPAAERKPTKPRTCKCAEKVLAELPPRVIEELAADDEATANLEKIMGAPVVLATALDDYNNHTDNLPAVVEAVMQAEPEDDVYLQWLAPEYDGNGFFDSLLKVGKSIGSDLLKNVVSTGIGALTGSAIPKQRRAKVRGAAMMGGAMTGGNLLAKYGRSYEGEMRKIGLAHRGSAVTGGFLAPLLGSLASGLIGKLF